MLDRRQFAATAFAFAGLALQSRVARAGMMALDPGYGPLQSDPAGLIDLPPGFYYKVVSALWQAMDDGPRATDRADGMVCFRLGAGRIDLVRTQEPQQNHLPNSIFATGTPASATAFVRTRRASRLGARSAT